MKARAPDNAGSPYPAALAIARCLLLTIPLAASFDSTAQANHLDANCNPAAVLPEKEALQHEILETHAGYRMISALVQKGCRAVNFVRNLGNRISSGRITNEDIVEAATDDIPYTSTGQRILDNVRNNARRLVATEGKVVRNADGTFAYEETSAPSSGLKSGAIVHSNGTMARGQFDASNRLQGTGQLVTADGTVRAGTFFNSALKGEGFVTGREGGRTVLVEGTFDGDTPVGEVVRTYADGSSVRERWENGRLVERGAVAAKGSIPPKLRSQPRQGLAAAPAAGDGWVEAADAEGKKRLELWCHGRMVDAGWWAPRGTVPQRPGPKPAWQACETRIPTQAPQGNIVSNTLESRASTAKGTFPCPLGGARLLHEQLRACAPEPRLIMSKPVPAVFDRADRQAVASLCGVMRQTFNWGHAWVASGDGQLMTAMYSIGSTFNLFGYPWAYIPKEKVALMSERDVDYVNRKLLEEKQHLVKSAADRAQLETYGRLQACMSRYALCKAGNRAYCGGA